MVKYVEKFKRSVFQDYLAGGGSYGGLSAKYAVTHGQIQHWVAAYRQNGDEGLAKKFSH